MIIVGIDPGVNGAAAVIEAYSQNAGLIHHVIDLPTRTVGKWREIDATQLLRWLDQMEPSRIIIENVHAMPRDGVTSSFRFGQALGMIKAASEAFLGANVLELVEPKVWKEYFELGPDKEEARQRAIDLFPEAANRYLTFKKDHNKAEALLIARWALRPPVGKDWS